MPTEPLTSQSEQTPATISKEGVVPRKRIKDAKSAHELYRKCRKDDEGSAANRAKIRGMFNGEPPYNENDLIRTGQADRTNLDFGKAAQLLEMSMAGYVDTILSTEKLLRCQTRYGDKALQNERSEIISEEISRMIRSKRRCFGTIASKASKRRSWLRSGLARKCVAMPAPRRRRCRR